MATIHQQITQWRDGLLAPNQNDVLLTLIQEKNAISIADFYKEEGKFSIEELHLNYHKTVIRSTNPPLRQTAVPVAQLKYSNTCIKF